MDELIDIVNNKGQATGKTCLKSYAHKNGVLHASIHVWLYTNQHKILIQKRSDQKEIYPNLWDVSVAGHIKTDEHPKNAAIREIKEEIGISISKDHLKLKNIWEEKHLHVNGLIDHEIHYIYIAKLNCELNLLTKQKEEVSDLKLIIIEQLNKDCKNPLLFVPHHQDYYQHIINLLKEIIGYEK